MNTSAAWFALGTSQPLSRSGGDGDGTEHIVLVLVHEVGCSWGNVPHLVFQADDSSVYTRNTQHGTLADTSVTPCSEDTS